ncbi:MAG: OadG family protein [Alistipes sp.]|nr:OadG family protein [Alistipes sp.]
MLWVALISICLVFFVLVLLVGVMKCFGLVFARRQPSVAAAPSGRVVVQGQVHEEEIAAIATALDLYRSAMHDRESEVLTILSIKRAYSPWNSKIHGLTQLPDRK